jgi:hypothetical protein
MAVYTGSPTAFETYSRRFASEEQRKANDMKGMDAWMKWVQDHQSSIVEGGGPLGRTKRVTKDGIADVRNNLGAYTIVEAQSQEDAAKMFLDHPHFTIFPGDGVEIMECLPIPQRG